MQHGQDESQISSSSMQDPPLTGTGFGQALSLSKKAAIYCNPNTGLEPELVVVSPFSRVLQTTMLAFPSSNTRNNTPWICHPALVDASGDLSNHPMEISDLQLTFPGMDYSLYDDNEKDYENGSTLESTTTSTHPNSNTTTLLESKEQLLHQADLFVRWLQRRPERVVVGKSIENWNWLRNGFGSLYYLFLLLAL
jgi:broad specificity phosphatase PhoE